MKNGQKLKLGMPPRVTPRNIQEVQASKLGDAQGIPFFINKNPRSSFKTLYFLLHALCVVLGASLFFKFYFVLFAAISWLDHRTLLLEIDTLSFHCLEHS